MKRTSRRGAAAVEMAITMVLLIPLIFFVLFLEDFVAYKMEGQEPVVAAAWDHITPDYMRKKPDVGGMNRLKYCDHTAAYDSYEQQFECNGSGGGALEGDEGDDSATGSSPGMGHHHATGAHQCWLGGGQQVRCAVSKGIEAAEFPTSKPFVTFFGSDWNKGGTSTCSAQLNVYNFIIPQRKQGWLWSKKANTNKTEFGKAGGGDAKDKTGWAEGGDGQSTYSIGAAHTDGLNARKGSDPDMGSWLLAKEEFGVLADPWALTDIDSVNPNKGSVATTQLPPGQFPGQDIYHPLLSRTGNYYNHYAKQAAKDGETWRKSMEQKEFLDKTQMFLGSGADTIGDAFRSVPVYWDAEQKRSNNSGYASGWQDSRQQSANRENNFPSYWGPKKAN